MHSAAFILLVSSFWISGCAPRVMRMEPSEGRPGTVVSLSMEYLVGWPRVEIGGKTMDYYQVRLLGLNPDRKDVPDMVLVWIEDKILQFRVLDLPPGDNLYSVLETTAYLIFPPVWPFVMRSNDASVAFQVTAE